MLFLLLGYSLAAGCGSPIYQQTIESDRYQIQLTLDGVGTGERTATIELRNKAGQPVDAEVLVLLPVMRDMGMASPEITATRTGIGRYEAKGELFSMDGAWEIDMRIGSGGSEETVSFPVTATQ